MTLQSPFRALAGEDGRTLLAALETFSEERAAAAAKKARSVAPADVAAAALATAFARNRARKSAKFDRPELMVFTREGYEQASSSAVARHRGERFAGLASVVDLCCGIGSDTVALALRAESVIAVDQDPDALACAELNAEAFGVAMRTRFVLGDALTHPLTGASAAFADPSRRRDGRRQMRANDYIPPLGALLARAKELPDAKLCVKAAPGLDLNSPELVEAAKSYPVEIEVVSERGACKEIALWCGGFARANRARRATKIDREKTHVLDGDPNTIVEPAALGDWIGEPDPSVIRSGLMGFVCAQLAIAPVDARVGYVTAPQPVRDPFVRWYHIRDAMAFGVKRLRAYLRERGIGRLVIKTRAFPLRPDAIELLLKPAGPHEAVLFCTTIGAKKTAIVCDPAT